MTTRDFSEKQYQAALRRNGFKNSRMGACWVVHEDFPTLSVGAIVKLPSYTIDRRATLAHAIKTINKERMKAATV